MASDIDDIIGIQRDPPDEGWFVTARGLYVNVEHRTCVLGFDPGLVIHARMQPTRFDNKEEAMKAAVVFQRGLTGRDASLPIRVVHRERVLHEVEFDPATGVQIR